MKTSNTTLKKQIRFYAYLKEQGISIDKITEWYKDPVKASVLNVMAEGL
jgi:hypothetical protein